MSTEMTVFDSARNTEGHIVGWVDKKGNTRELTMEGALWKGGDALKQLKSEASASAQAKAVGGRYRAAYDIFTVAFPSIAKALETLHIGLPYANKSSMATVLLSVLGQKPKAGKEFSAKQREALELARSMLDIPAFSHLRPQGEVIENEAEQSA